MCIIKQCCAPVGDQQCTKQTLNNNCDHCEIHHDEALKLYLKYKEICAVANSKKIYVKIKDRDQHIKHLMHCLRWLENAYDAREEHQLYAYVPEKLDGGHKEQFNIIQDKIDYCRDKVTQLYKELQDMEHSKQEEEMEESETELPCEELVETSQIAEKTSVKSSILDKLEGFKSKQMKDKMEFDKILKRNTRQNKKIKQEKTKAATLCKNLIIGLLEKYPIWDEISESQKCDEMFLALSVFSTLVELHNLHYYADDYEPLSCPNCNCGNFKEYEYKLGCPCFLRKDNNTVSVLAYNDLPDLKLISNDILYYSDLIDPIIEDLLQCYKKHGTRLIKKMMMLLWDPDEERLVLSYDGVTWKSKPSEMMKRARTRKSIQMLQNNDTMTKDDDELTFGDILKQLCNYIDRNDKLPSSNSKQSHTLMLYDWLREQQNNWTNEYGTMLVPENKMFFEKFISKYHRYFLTQKTICEK
jgi:hypothetical protein